MKRWLAMLLILLTLIPPATATGAVPGTASGAAPVAGPALEWHGLTPVPAVDLAAVSYGNGRFVAVGRAGTILTSTTGAAWQIQASGTRVDLTSIAFGQGLFVAAGDGNQEYGLILTSPDGINWSRREVRPATRVASLVFCGGRFTASGWGWEPGEAPFPLLLSSPDGITWQSRRAERLPDHLRCGPDGQALAIAAGPSGVTVWTEAEGYQTRAGAGFYGWSREVHAIATETGLRIYQIQDETGRHKPGFTLWSANGLTWVEEPGAPWASVWVMGSTGSQIAAGDRIFATGGGEGMPTGLYRSADGLAWQRASLPEPDALALKGFAYGGGNYIAVGLTGRIFHSTDGLDWTEAGSAARLSFTQVAAFDGRFVALEGQAGRLWLSADGERWQQQPPLAQEWSWSLMAGPEGFALVGGLTLYTSTDGLHWTEQGTLPSSARELSGGTRIHLTPGGLPGHFLAVSGGSGYTWASTDGGRTWLQSPTRLPGLPGSIIHTGGRYLASVQRQGSDWRDIYAELHASEDGLDWRLLAGTPRRAFRLAECHGQLIATEPGLVTGSSADGGLTWTEHQINGAGGRVACLGGRFVGLAPEGITISADGLNWTMLPAIPGWLPESAAFGNGRYVLAGEGGLYRTAPRCGAIPDLAATDPACAAVGRLMQAGVLNGFPDGLFRPAAGLTRAQAAKVLVLALELAPRPDGPLPFGDALGHWAAAQGYLQPAVALGLVDGFPDGTFRPEGPVTREQLIKLVAAAAGLHSASAAGLSSASVPSHRYTDLADDAWSAGWVAAALQAKMIGPGAATPLWPGPDLNPTTPVTRAEAAILLHHLQSYLRR